MYNDMLDFKFFKDLFWDFFWAISNNLFGASDEVLPKKINSMWFKSDLQLIFYRNNSNAELLNLSFFENFTFQHSFFYILTYSRTRVIYFRVISGGTGMF